MLVLTLSIVVGYSIYWMIGHHRRKEAQALAQQILEQAKDQTAVFHEEIYERQRIEIEKKRHNFTELLDELQESNSNLERKIQLQEREILYHQQKIEHLETVIGRAEESVAGEREIVVEAEKRLQEIQTQIQDTLLERSGHSSEQIRERFLSEFEKTVDREKDLYYERYLHYINTNAERIAARILSAAIHRCSFGHWCETYSSSVNLPEEELPEQLLALQDIFSRELDVDLEYDANFHSISIVTADGCKREIAAEVLQDIIDERDYDHHNATRLIAQKQQEMEQDILCAGREACKKLGLELSSDIYKLLGRLKYRTSFGQNVLAHSLEVSHLAKLTAAEIGLDAGNACRAGLLHDIGKAVDHEQEGGHPEIGGEILENFHEAPEIIEGVIGHHEDVQSETPYATIINAADAISASRPGARRETFEKYIKRLEKLESIAYSVPGIENAFAISAGREIRVMVNPDKISDEQTDKIAETISKAIEEELHYPGKIKITVIREMKVIEYAH